MLQKESQQSDEEGFEFLTGAEVPRVETVGYLGKKELQQKVGGMSVHLPGPEQKQVQKMAQLISVPLDLDSPRMKLSLDLLGLCPEDLEVPADLEWPGRTMAGFEDKFAKLKTLLSSVCENRKDLIRHRNQLKKQEREEKEQEAAGMVVDQYGQWNNRSVSQTLLTPDNTYLFDTTIYSKGSTLQLLNVTQRHRNSQGVRALQSNKVQDLMYEICMSQSMSKLNARTQQCDMNKKALLDQKVRENQDYDKMKSEHNLDNKKVLISQFREKQRKLRDDIQRKEQLQQSNLEVKLKEEQEYFLEKNLVELEKMKQIMILKESQKEAERQRGVNIMANQEQREQDIRDSSERHKKSLDKQVRQRQRAQAQKMKNNLQLFSQQQHSAISRQVQQNQATQKHLSGQQNALQKSISERQEIQQNKHNDVHTRISRHRENHQSWKDEVVRVIDRKTEIKTQIIRKKEEGLQTKKQIRELSTQKVVNKNLENQLHDLQNRMSYEQTSRDSLVFDHKCRNSLQKMVTHSLNRKVRQNVRQEQLNDQIISMVQKGKYDQKSIAKLLSTANISEQLGSQISKLVEPSPKKEKAK